MLEIHIADEIQVPFCERTEKRVRVHTSIQHTFKDLLDAIGGELTHLERQYLSDLWSNDNARRSYTKIDGGGYLVQLTEVKKIPIDAIIAFGQSLL
jgi:hypothetical protein